MKYITEDIKENYLKWGNWTTIYLTAPTGAGKTKFILDVLYRYAVHQGRKMLYLVNRKILKEQIRQEVSKINSQLCDEKGIEVFSYITIMTYQELEEKILTNENMIYYQSQFFYLIADECHYFYNDANFNTRTSVSYEFVFSAHSLCRIFVSATMDRIEKCTERRIIDWLKGNFWTKISRENYDREIDYSYVNFDFFQNDDEIIRLVQKSGEEKWVIFVDNKDKGSKLNKRLKSKKITSEFVDAAYSSETAEDEVKNIVKNKKTSCQVLIATSVLDNGISIVDKKLKNMIILADTKETFIQMLGRKRREDVEEKINLYVKKRKKSDFEYRKEFYVQKRIDFCNKYIAHVKAYYMGAAKIDYIDCDYVVEESLKNNTFYECIKSLCYLGKCTFIFNNQSYLQNVVNINPFAVQQFNYLYSCYEHIIERFEKEGDNAFLYEQGEWLGIKNIREIVAEKEKEHYNTEHIELIDEIEKYFAQSTVEKDEDNNVLLSTNGNIKFKQEILEKLREIISLKVDLDSKEWADVKENLRRNDRVFYPDIFNKIMSVLEYDYYMQERVDGRKKVFIISKK